ncbi:MAG: hypothetical protein EBZ58_10820 [Bacteroidetes bacterium]|nr:hypothetical protein [Bacteroidota bacterium]
MSRVRSKYYKFSNDLNSNRILEKNKIPENESQNKETNKLDMKWNTIQYANSGNPQVWGPAFWFTLHNGAVRYPIKASSICAERMKGFILGMPVMIPCEKCQDHATSHIEQNYHRLDEIVSGREQLFNFFVSFHNYVNRRYDKPEMSNEDAYALYTGEANVTKLEYSAK